MYMSEINKTIHSCDVKAIGLSLWLILFLQTKTVAKFECTAKQNYLNRSWAEVS